MSVGGGIAAYAGVVMMALLLFFPEFCHFETCFHCAIAIIVSRRTTQEAIITKEGPRDPDHSCCALQMSATAGGKEGTRHWPRELLPSPAGTAAAKDPSMGQVGPPVDLSRGARDSVYRAGRERMAVCNVCFRFERLMNICAPISVVHDYGYRYGYSACTELQYNGYVVRAFLNLYLVLLLRILRPGRLQTSKIDFHMPPNQQEYAADVRSLCAPAPCRHAFNDEYAPCRGDPVIVALRQHYPDCISSCVGQYMFNHAPKTL